MVQHVTEKVGDRGFAVGSRDSYPRDVVEGLPSQLDLPADLNTLLAQDFKGWVIPWNPGPITTAVRSERQGSKLLMSRGMPNST
jgi:hypothetical protein